MDIESLLTAPLPPIPLAMTFTAHWLAIEGVQPLIPQNPPPTPAMLAANNAQQLNAAAAQPNKSESAEGETVQSAIAPAETLAKPLVKHVLSKEAQLYYEKMTAALKNTTSLQLRELAWQALAEDAGLHQLVPYLVHFIQHQVICSFPLVAYPTAQWWIRSRSSWGRRCCFRVCCTRLMHCYIILAFSSSLMYFISLPAQSPSSELVHDSCIN